MQAIEIDARIDAQGNIHLPEHWREYYGKQVRVIVLLPEHVEKDSIDPMTFSGTVDWPVDGLLYQQEVRAEWN